MNAGTLRMKVCGVMRKAMPPVSNMSKHQRIALKELKQMKDVVIMPADKGNNTTVLMTREEYNKMEDLLDTNTVHPQLSEHLFY